MKLENSKYSSETLYNYERDLNMFAKFLRENRLPFEKIDKRTINSYKEYLTSHNRKTTVLNKQNQLRLSPRSINRMLSALRSYFRYLMDIDYPSPIPFEVIKLTKGKKNYQNLAGFVALNNLIEAPSKLETNEKVALRNRAMLEVLFATGMRISELCSLNRHQIDGSGRIFIAGKGRKQRFVYLTPRAHEHLNEYLMTRDDSFQALFIPYAGKNVTNRKKRISTNYLQERIKRYREKLGINVPTSAHSLRIGFAIYLLEERHQPIAIETLHTHESFSSITRYLHLPHDYAGNAHLG